MAIDASIYQNIQAPQTPQPLDMATKAMYLSQLGMQQYQQRYQMAQVQATRQALDANTDPGTGQTDYQGAINTLNKAGYQQAGMGLAQQIAAQQKAAAEASAAKSDAENKAVGVGLPYLEYFDSAPKTQQATMFPTLVKTLADKGMPMQNVPTTWDPVTGPQWLASTMAQIKQTPAYLAQQAQGSEIKKNQAQTKEALSNANMGPAKLGSELYGSRSPNAELSAQYTTDVKGLRASQINMQQMLDSFGNKTPQGDASLVLQNFKIRNPSVPDVNSVEEMKDSQAVSDTWKNKLSQALAGGFDDNTRQNLIRDGISAYRANMVSLQGIQKRYQARAVAQNVNDPTLTYEPAMMDTANQATALQKQLGPYVPATQRGGIISSVAGAASRLMGLGGNTANASAQAPAAGGFSLNEIRAELARRKGNKGQ